MNRTARWSLALLASFSLVAGACGDDDEGAETTGEPTEGTTGEGGGETATGCAATQAPDDAPAIVIAAQDFGESKILAAIYEACLDAAGFDASVQELGGYRDIELTAFEGGDINLAPEYAASMLEALNGDATEATSDPAETTELLNGYLADIGLTALTPSDAVDTNAFVVTQETAEELGLTSISDLADHADLTLGAPSDCETNAFCLPGLLEVYGVDLSAGFTALEAGAIGDALDGDAIDIALLFSTDSRIAANDWVLLEDDRSMLAADNILPVATTEVAETDGVADLLDAISAALDTAGLTELNRRFDVDLEDAEDIAQSFLADAGLL